LIYIFLLFRKFFLIFNVAIMSCADNLNEVYDDDDNDVDGNDDDDDDAKSSVGQLSS